MRADDADGRVARLDLGVLAVTVMRQAVAPWTARFTRAPDAGVSETRRLSIGFNVVHVRGPGLSVLVDPGLDDPRSRWGRRYAASHPFTRFDATASETLEGLGEDPGAVTHVAITHAHLDHVVGATVDQASGLRPRFAHARHVLMRADRTRPRYDRDELGPDVAERLACLETSGLLDLLDGPAVLLHRASRCTPRQVSRPDTPSSRSRALRGRASSSGTWRTTATIRDAALMPEGRDPAALWRSRMHWYARAADRGARVVLAHSARASFGRIERAPGGRFEWRDEVGA
nr:MBL fold metallo-hydrolase [Deltaproteobacteria bacterium]